MASLEMAFPASAQTSRAAPAKKVLIALTVLVLIGHWFALGGRISLWSDHGFKTPSELGTLPQDNPSADTTAMPDFAAPPPDTPWTPVPVTTSIVRWITPPPPAPPAPEPKPPPPQPVKVAKRPPPEPEPLPEPEVEAAQPLPMPDPYVLAQPLPVEPIETPAPVSDPAIAAQPPQNLPSEPIPIALSEDSIKGNPAASPPTKPVAMAPNATLNYDVVGKAKGFNYSASGTLSWHQDGTTYEAQLEVSAFLLGTYVQTSTGMVTPQGLAPERFSDKRRSNEKAAHFDRATGRIRYSNNAPDARLLPDAQDQLSITLQLASLLNTYPALSDARTVSLPVSSTGSSEIWPFEVGSLTTLKLPAGEVKARLLTRAPRREYDKTVELWLAPEFGNLPVRIRLTEHNGDFLDLLLEDLPDIAQPANTAQP